ncbi:MAG: hypothetical protein A2Y73_02895 [Chloroflexi bacterium RBG_13_56_8]|nr:MAG: hypothetical protein A2Y73_02895 [Chloroflexi bacterium RBG_13_56_8]
MHSTVRDSWFVRVFRQATLAILLALLVIVLVGGVGFLAYQICYGSRIYQGVRILGRDVGGLSSSEALEVVSQELGGEQLPYVSLHTADQVWTVSLQEMGGYFDLSEAVQKAWELGRSGSFREDMRARLRLLGWGYHIVPAFYLEPGQALVCLRKIAQQAAHPARRAQLWVEGLQARTDESEEGRELDMRATREGIEASVSEALGPSGWEETPLVERLWHNRVTEIPHFGAERIPVTLAFRQVVPPLTEVAGAEEQLSTILSSPLTLLCDFREFEADGTPITLTRRWSVDRAMLSSWLTLQSVQTESGTEIQVGVDPEKIDAYLQTLSQEISRPPREGRFTYDPKGQVLTTLSPGQNGYALDVAETRIRIEEACLSSAHTVALPVYTIAPRVTREDLEALMPLQLISEGQTGFSGSTASRLQNIRVATSRFHGLTVPPEATFSFLQNLGLVTVANGYTESWIIYLDRTILGPGGGVCQVSTTCFRAAFWGGYPIVERWPHSYRVSWYEPPLGLDAAVFSPSVDFKFRNDTDTPILILTEVDEENSKLYFRFYGKSPGREVSLEGPVTSNVVEPEEPIMEQDPSLAPGSRVQVEWAHDGLDVVLYRVIEKDGVVLANEQLFSRYVPWPARFRVGPSEGDSASTSE